MTKEELTKTFEKLSEMILEYKKEKIYLHFTVFLNYIDNKLYFGAFVRDEVSNSFKSIDSIFLENSEKYIAKIEEAKNRLLLKRKPNKDKRIKELEKQLKELKEEEND